MNSLLKQITTNSCDKSLIYKLESEIKNNWTYYSPEKPYSHFIFCEVFSEVLMEIESKKLLKKQDVAKLFKNSYRKSYDETMSTISKVEGLSHPEIIKQSKLCFKNLEPCDFLILFKYLNDREAVKTPKAIEVMAKLKFNSQIGDDAFLDTIKNCNFVSLYLIRELGFRKYREFTDLVDQLGMYYPFGKLPDSEVILNIKDGLLKKFMESIQNTDVKHLPVIEKLIFD